MKKTRKMLEIEGRLGEPLEDYLRRKYVDNRDSSIQIAKDIGVSNQCISRWLNDYGIEIRGKLPEGVTKPSKEELEERYRTNGEARAIIAKDIGVSDGTVLGWLRGYGIPIRNSVKDRLGVIEEILEEFTYQNNHAVWGDD